MTFEQIKNSLPTEPLREVGEIGLEKIATGKVREIFAINADELLIVATDRVSAFDVVLPGGLAGKGILLTQLSLWWFEQTRTIIDDHIPENHSQRVQDLLPDNPELHARSMVVRRLKPLALEAVVRGYLAGSGFKEYQQTGALWDHSLPEGLVDSSQLPHPLFTPTTKATSGHDEPVTAEQGRAIVGAQLFDNVRDVSLALYQLGATKAAQAGVLLADTKFEFGLDGSGKLYLIDEALTPDSSRYWPAEHYTPGKTQASYDKQIVRNYLESLDWDKTPPGPELPAEINQRTLTRYLELLKKLMG